MTFPLAFLARLFTRRNRSATAHLAGIEPARPGGDSHKPWSVRSRCFTPCAPRPRAVPPAWWSIGLWRVLLTFMLLCGVGNVRAMGIQFPPMSFSAPLGGSSATQYITLYNGQLSRYYLLSAFSLWSGASGDFSLAGSTCSSFQFVPPQSTCTIAVTFTPTAAGTRTTLLVFSSCDDPEFCFANVTITGTTTTSANSIAIDPVTPATLYSALEGGGIYKSVNGGTNWSPATTQPANARLKALVINPTDRTKLYVASYGGGVYTSSNSGLDWSACATQPANLNLLSLVIDSSGKLYAGSEAGVFASSDGCATWTTFNNGLPQ